MADLIGKTILQLTMVDGVVDPDKSYVEIHQVGMPYSQRIAVSALAKNGLSAKQVVQLSHPEVVTDEDFINFISGADGKSAYDLAKDNGYIGTLTQWLASLKGAAGKDGLPGANGKTVYQLAQDNGYTGTLNDWLASLVGKQGASGADGKSAYQIAKDAGYPGTITQWLASLQGIPGTPGLPGQDGKSAYQLAVEGGFPGSLTDYLSSLQGPAGHDGADGAKGDDGLSAYELAQSKGFTGTLEEYLESLNGAPGYNGADGQPGQDGVDGKSAYEVAQDAGFDGTVFEWLVSLRGPAGQDGVNGTNGIDGIDGKDGKDGASVVIKGLIDAPENLPEGEPVSTAYIIGDNIWIMGESGWFDAGQFRGDQGPPGLTAYQLAQSTGFVGSLADFLASLVGEQGPQGVPGVQGDPGLSAYDQAVSEGFDGTFEQWLLTFRGTDGNSAYELAVEDGFQGTLTEWLASLVGPAGSGGDGTGGNALGASEVLVPDSALANSTTFDGALGNFFNVTLTADFTVPPVLHPQPGVKYRWLLKQDRYGQHKITLDKKYKFTGNIMPITSADGQAIDLLEAEYSSDGFFFSKYFKGYNITPIARIGDVAFDTMAAAVTASKNNDTIYVTRNGSMAECIASLRADQSLTIAGDPSISGLPRLHVDGTITLAGQKAIINPEAGYTIIRDLSFDGAATPDLSGSGVRGNPGQRYMRLERVLITMCENGILAGAPNTTNTLTDGYNIEAIDTVFDANGQGYDGQSHNIYLNHKIRARFLRCQFLNAKHGHDFKSRAAHVVLDRVLCRGALEARELDLPNGCILHAVNCSFIKLSNQTSQWELVGIGREGVDNVEEYVFRNCLFQNDAPNFGPCWVFYQNTKTTPVTLRFIDCVFIGGSRCHINSPTPYEVIYTGGPIGPEGWDQTNRGVFPRWGAYDTNAGTIFKPDDQQLQPIYSADPTLDVFPPTGSTATPTKRPENATPDVSPPQVTLIASSTDFTANGTLTLTANAMDDTGVTMVELYQDGELIDMDNTNPYSFSRQITADHNGSMGFTVKAYDAAGNVGLSNNVIVNVDIVQLPPPTDYPFAMDSTTLADYNNAIDAAVLGTKRQAGAMAIAADFGSNYTLSIYQEAVLVIQFVFATSMLVADDGTNVTVSTPTPNPVDPLIAADITQGTWHFELVSTDNSNTKITGSVGPVNSGKLIEIADNPEPGTGQAFSCVLTVPRSVDGLS